MLHLNKGDDNARGHIGTELNNKAESVLLIAKDTKDADRSVVSPAVIRSKAFAPFAFKLSEDDGLCLPELDTEFAVTNSPSFSYQELSGEEHRKALQETFKTDTELGYGSLLTRLGSAYQSIHLWTNLWSNQTQRTPPFPSQQTNDCQSWERTKKVRHFAKKVRRFFFFVGDFLQNIGQNFLRLGICE